MGGKHRLNAGVERLYSGQGRGDARLYCRYAAELVREHGIDLGDRSLLALVEVAAALRVTFRRVTEALVAAREQRDRGRGRRPSAAQIDRLEHRQITAASAYQAACDALRAAVPPPNIHREWARQRGQEAAEYRARAGEASQ